MQLSRRGDYGTRVILDLAAQPAGTTSSAREIAERQGIPLAFLSKIISQLSVAGLLETRRGAQGGVGLTRPADRITLLEVIEALEGPIVLNRCLIRGGECEKDCTCPIRPIWAQVQIQMRGMLANTNFAALAEENRLLNEEELERIPQAA